MTKPLPFTQAALQRAIRAARAEGLRVTAIKPADGTVLVDDGGNSPIAVPLATTEGNDAAVAPAADPWESLKV